MPEPGSRRLGRAVLRAVLVLGGLGLLGALVVFTPVFLVRALQLKHVRLRPLVSVYDRESKAPVPGCLLSFRPTAWREEGEPRTGRDGQAQGVYESEYMHDPAWMMSRRREPRLRFSVGQIPVSGVDSEAEVWDVQLRFREPWGWANGAEIVPQVQLTRSLVHLRYLDGFGEQEVSRVLEPAESEAVPLRATVRLAIEPDSSGERRSYDIPLSISLGREQIAACQAATLVEVLDRMEARFASGRCQEALEDFRSLKFRGRDLITPLRWVKAHEKAGACLARLGRKQEALETYRKAGELWPSRAADFSQAALALR